jgi:hypothetical protein
MDKKKNSFIFNFEMRQFAIKILKYGLFTMLFVTGLFLWSYQIIHSPDYWNTGQTEILFSGHSHPECAFNDKLISKSLNVSKSGESYFYTYLKLRKILPNNKKIKVVYLEFGTNNIFQVMDNWTWGDKIIGQNYPRFHPLMTTQDELFLKKNQPQLSNLLVPKTFIKENVFTIVSKVFIRKGFRSNTRFGGFVPLRRVKATQDMAEMAQISEDSLKISKGSLTYLKKINRLCIQNGKKLILVRCPVHRDYTHPKQEVIFQEYRRNYLNNIPFLDYGNLIEADSLFSDKGHLNEKGADLFTQYFNKTRNEMDLSGFKIYSSVEMELKK